MPSSDYVAPFVGNDVTFTAAAPIAARQLVRVVADKQLSATAGASDAWLGIATQAAGIGQPVAITSGGYQEPFASGSITAGDPVVTAAAGRAARGSSVTAPGYVGTAVTSAVDGAPVLVRMAR